jgi:predicted transcriptional regulator
MKTVGDQELALLRFIAETGPSTVGEVAEKFGEPRGLARSTVLTMMERLRQKAHLEREQVEGVYRYSTREASDDEIAQLEDLVARLKSRKQEG